MTSLRRDKRLQRIERDTGDPDDDVVYAVHGQSINAYHVDEDCVTLPSDCRLKTITRQRAKNQFRAPCKSCVLDEDVERDPTSGASSCKGTNNKGESCGNAASVAGYCPEHLHQRGEDDD